jgi:hypothetical protein
MYNQFMSEKGLPEDFSEILLPKGKAKNLLGKKPSTQQPLSPEEMRRVADRAKAGEVLKRRGDKPTEQK